MVFSSLEFLFLFLPCTLLFYFLSGKKYRNLILVLFSLIFYAWGEPVYILIMIFSTVFDYFNGLLIEKFRNKNKSTKWILILSLVGNLGILAYFKYTNFLISTINQFFNSEISLLALTLPIGISFYTFQTLSYTIDVYLGIVKANHNIIDFACYVTCFPQLVAGPIVQYKDIEKQLAFRKTSIDQFAYGIQRFIIGLFKKVLIANQCGALWEVISKSNLNELSFALAWLGIIAFAFQIYFDFSGYSDMAIGLGHMFGFTFLENFNYPYLADSVSDFWRRWHISLGNWFREYVYIPLGGSRCSKKRLIFNLLVVWSLTGLWHGASYNFIAWGLYFGILLIIEKVILKDKIAKVAKPIRILVTFIIICFGWVLFAFEQPIMIENYLKAMIGMNGLIESNFYYYLSNYAILLIIASLFALKGFDKIQNFKFLSKLSFLKPMGLMILMIICLAFLVGDSYNPFLYFRF